MVAPEPAVPRSNVALFKRAQTPEDAEPWAPWARSAAHIAAAADAGTSCTGAEAQPAASGGASQGMVIGGVFFAV